MGKCFSQDDIFPIIAEAIDSLCQDGKSYAEHEEIAAYLLRHPQASGYIKSACKASDKCRSQAWMAGNMIAWFSKGYTGVTRAVPIDV